MRRKLALGFAVAAIGAAGVKAAVAQDAGSGLVSSDRGSTGLDPSGFGSGDLGGNGLGAGDLGANGLSPTGIGATSLRGTAGGDADGLAPATSSDDPTDSNQGRSGTLRLRSTVQADDGSVPRIRQGAPTLPALEPYPGAVRKPRGAALDTVDPSTLASPVIGPTVAALPAPLVVRRAKPDPTPYAPLGYTIGSLRFTPFVEQSLGFDSNPDQVATGVKPSAFSRTEGGFDLLSLWSSNQLSANMHGAYNDFFSNAAANRPDAAGTVDYRYDVSRDLAVDAEGRFAVTTQRPGSPELNAEVKDRPLVSSFGASVGGSDSLGRLTVALHGTFDRTSYENGVLPDGTVVLLNDEDFNDYGVTGRVGYELTPGLKPFVQVTADQRIHDQRIDNSGYARDSDGVSGLVGTTFELTHLITGQVSAGYGNRSYEDPRLRDLNGPLVDASLIYAVTPLTTLTLAAATSFDETTVAGSPGTESRTVSLQVSHALLRNLTLTGIVSYLNTDYVDSAIKENTISGTLKASYSLSRSIVLDASYNHETLLSTVANSGFSQDVFLFGVRLQH